MTTPEKASVQLCAYHILQIHPSPSTCPFPYNYSPRPAAHIFTYEKPPLLYPPFPLLG